MNSKREKEMEVTMLNELKTQRHSTYEIKTKMLNSNLRHLEFIDFYEGHLRSRERTEFVDEQLESLKHLKNNIKSELVIVYSRLKDQ